MNDDVDIPVVRLIVEQTVKMHDASTNVVHGDPPRALLVERVVGEGGGRGGEGRE